MSDVVVKLDDKTPLDRIESISEPTDQKRMAYSTIAAATTLACGAAAIYPFFVDTLTTAFTGEHIPILPDIEKALINLPWIMKTSFVGSWWLYLREYRSIPKKVSIYATELHPYTWLIPIGKNRDKKWIYLDFEKTPHFKCGGCTGSGKTYAMQCILAMLSQMHTPDYLEMRIIDMKEGASFAAFENLPHVHGVYSDAYQALESLEEVKAIMAERLQMIRDARRRFQPLPTFKRIIVAIDEGGELAPAFIADKEEKEVRKKCMDILSTLARVGREPKISVFYTTQRPSDDTLPVGIRGQLEGTLCFRMENELDSKILLRREGAEKLKKIPGRMIYKTPDMEEEIQFLHIPDSTLQAWLTAWGYGYEADKEGASAL